MKEADRLLTIAEEDNQKAGIYNQINRISFGAYSTDEKYGRADERDLDRAIDALQTAIRLNPKEPSYFFNLAICFQKKGNQNGALDAIQNCMDLGSEDDDHLALAYHIFEKYGKKKEAQKVKEKLKMINPLRAEALD